MKSRLLLLLVTATIISAFPQGGNIEELIEDVFGEKSVSGPKPRNYRQDRSIDELIKDVFGGNGQNAGNRKNPAVRQAGEENCACVPYYMCSDGTSLDKPGVCENSLDVCCIRVTEEKPVSGQTPGQEGTKKPAIRQTGEEDCTCVPYYQCPNGTVLTDGTGLLDIKAKPGACEDYMDVCCKEPLEEDHVTKPPSTKREGCGRRHPEGIGFRITGDTNNEAQFGEFPWMTAILKRNVRDGVQVLEYQCGGALIHQSVVLTAAHCVKIHSEKDILIRAGEWDTQRNNEVFPHKDEGIAEIIVHPDFNSGNLRYDYALLILQTPLKLGDNIDTVCLPDSGAVPHSTECFATGWGKDKFGEKGRSQVILKKIDLPIVARDRCQSMLRETRLGQHFNLHKSFVCAGGVPGKDTCKGDGGGPLVCPIQGQHGVYEITGIVAWGIGCGGEVPGIYADVAYARKWIDENLSKHNIQLE